MITAGTFLMIKNGNEYKKLVDIKDHPDLGGAPEMVEKTTLSHIQQVFDEGIQTNEALEFTANYDLTDYQTILALKGQEKSFSVWFGGDGDGTGMITPTGTFGKYNFNGKISVRPLAGGVNEIRNMGLTIAPSTAITLASD